MDIRGTSTSTGQVQNELKENTVIIVFGASGDLAKKKTFPALFGLYKQGLLPRGVHIVGYARTKMNDEEFKKREVSYVKGTDDSAVKSALDEFKEISSYISGPYDEDSGFQALEEHLLSIETKYAGGPHNRLFYFALPPSVFIPVAQGVKKHNYSKNGINRLIIEKPFGKDLESSRELLSAIGKQWAEEETFRIDHYLGKEVVKNILLFRFSNGAFSPSWNNRAISSVQITFKEPFGTEGRGGYFDEFGIIRDILQNHLTQVLTILAMEPPASFGAKDIRDEKVKVLQAISPITPEDTLLGQYVAAKGKPGYLDDDTVPKGSKCPTFAATTLYIKNERWEGVPFILIAGKALDEAKVEVRIQFKDVNEGAFKDIPRNELVFRIQPSEAVYLKINAKVPGLHTRALPTNMDLTYKRQFPESKIPDAYEVLILDALRGDSSNFVRDDELDGAWKIFTPILHWIDGKNGDPIKYEYGSTGPEVLGDYIAARGYRPSDGQYFWPTPHAAL